MGGFGVRRVGGGLGLQAFRFRVYLGVSEIRGTVFWGPYNKDPTIQGTILGSPIFGNSHLAVQLEALGSVFSFGVAVGSVWDPKIVP